ncbi:hypothetical protein VPH35_092809 [Triticum aestivum]|uniref:uncharacterized protein isoform X2 n=1 Tax=Triticum aestivum TaxID=4565 RepID=UPI0008449A6B|nr:uncharacterized protein LOC123113529 isoform X2 [Triticum aestivum]XP_044390731.1 uncharacterized protein LOC123113529 isoform X2 [Triticum aestivum]
MESNARSSFSPSETANEIDIHRECRYIAPNEAVWRLPKYDIHHTYPSTERLPVILAGMKIDSVPQIPKGHVIKKSFSIANAQVLPSTKPSPIKELTTHSSSIIIIESPMIQSPEDSNNTTYPSCLAADIDTEEKQNKHSLAKRITEFAEDETTNKESQKEVDLEAAEFHLQVVKKHKQDCKTTLQTTT